MSKSNIEEFYELVKGDYDLSYEEFKTICNTPFAFIKDLSFKVLRDIRFKYFGIFKVSKSKVKYYKKGLKESHDKGNITEEYFTRRNNLLEEYEQSQTNN